MSLNYRFIIFLPSLFLISFICFSLLESRPGDFFSATSEISLLKSAQQEAQLRQIHGTNLSVGIRYKEWLSNILLHWNWGYSLIFQQPVINLLQERLWITLGLTCLMALLKWCTALPLALYASGQPHGWFSQILGIISQISASTPDFVLAILVISLSLFIPLLSDHFFICAVIIGAFNTFGFVCRLLQTRFTEIRQQSFIANLSIQGLPKKAINHRILKHSFPLMVSMLANELPLFFSGAIIISIVFNLPTLGPFFQQAIILHDTYLSMAIVMILATIVQLGQLAADIVLFLFNKK